MPEPKPAPGRNLTSRLQPGRCQVGTILSLDSPEVAEIMSHCGFDWFWIDMEHSALSCSDTQRLIMAIGARCPAIVRIPENDSAWFKRVLDTGCDGVLVPMVNSAEAARKAVDACRYPPLGKRSIGVSRAHGYGMKFREYVDASYDSIDLIIQCEHHEAVANIESILEVEGISAILIGPYDLSGSFNRLGDVKHEEVQQAIDMARKACKAKGMPVGIFCMDVKTALRLIPDCYDFIGVSLDSVILGQAARAMSEALHGEGNAWRES